MVYQIDIPEGPAEESPAGDVLDAVMNARTALGIMLSKTLKLGMVLSTIFIPIWFVLGLVAGTREHGSALAGILTGLGIGGLLGLWSGPCYAAFVWALGLWGIKEDAHAAFVIDLRRQGVLEVTPPFYIPDATGSFLFLVIEIVLSPITFLACLWRWWRMTSWIKAHARFPFVQQYLADDGSRMTQRLRKAMIVYLPGTAVAILLAIVCGLMAGKLH